MILEPKSTTIAYRCPICGTITYGVIGVMGMAGNKLLKLKCTCNESEIILQSTEDNKIRITVPCMFCPNPHIFVISKKVLFSEPLFVFGCPYADIDMCFIGNKDKVDIAVEESETMLAELIDDADRETLTKINRDRNENDYGDESVRDSILFTIGDMLEEKHITCDCEGNCNGEYIIENGTDSVTVKCKKCGCKRTVICDHSIDTEVVLDSDFLKLT